MKRPILTRILIGTGALLGLGAVGTGWLLATESGTAWLISRVCKSLPMLSVEAVSGTVSDLTLTNFRVTTEGFDLKAENTRLRLDLAGLFSKEVRITSAAVDGLSMTVSETPESDEPEEAAVRLSLPVKILVGEADIRRTSLEVAGMRYSLSHLTSGYTWIGDAMRLLHPVITEFELRELPKEKPAEPKIRKSPKEISLGIHEALHELVEKPLLTLPVMDEIGPLSFDLSIEGLEIGESRFFLSPDAVEPDLSLTDTRITAALTGFDTDIAHFSTRSSLEELPSLTLAGTLSMKETWPLKLDAKAETALPGLPLGTLSLNADGALGDTVSLTAKTAGELKARLDVDWAPAKPGIPGKVVLATETPLYLTESAKAEDRLRLSKSHLKLEGNVASWNLAGVGSVKRGNLPDAILSVKGLGRPEGAALSDLRLSSGSGTAVFAGDVSWNDILRWRGLLKVESLDLTDFVDVPAENLTGEARVRGRFAAADNWQTEIPDFKLTGLFREKPLKSEGALLVRDTYRLYAPKVSVTLGDNTATFLAKFDKPVFEADLKIDAPTLADFDPTLRGRLMGSVLLRGNPEHPVFVANLKGQNLGYGETSVEEATLGGTIKPDRKGTVGGKMALVAKRISDKRSPQLNAKVLALVLDGTENKHTVKFGVQGKPYAVGLRLEGAFDRRSLDWRGSLASARITTPTGLWSQDEKAALYWKNAAARLTIGAHSWSHPDAKLHFEKLSIGSSGEVAVKLDRLGLRIFDTFLPNDSHLSGSLAGGANIGWTDAEGASPLVNIRLHSKDLAYHREIERSDGGDTVRLTLPIEDFLFAAKLDRQRADLDWNAAMKRAEGVTTTGRFSGHIAIDDPSDEKRLSGHSSIETLNMNFLNSFFQTGEKAEGLASGELEFRGSLTAPELIGHLKVDGLRIAEGMTPIDMKPSDLSLRFLGTQSSLSGLFKTDQGELSLEGLADWSDIEAPTAEIRATGENLVFTVPPYAKLRVSPDVFAKAEPEKITLGGLIEIPFAKIVVNEMPVSTVGVSRDEVMLTDDLLPVKPKTASIPIESALRIRLGDRVKLEAFGLKTKMTGEVAVLQNKRGLGLNGQVNLKNGRFKAYGQDLQVEKGSVIFSGPVDRPTLDVAAIRNPEKTEDDVVAGIHVTGTADNPKVEIFSRPAMPRQEALAYLLRGHGIEAGGDENDNAVLTSALIGIGISQTGNVIGTIGDTFGIRDFGVDTAGTGENSQVVVSGYVLPRLQVKYGVGLFDSLSTLTLRYRLMPKLFLESVSGVNQSVDLLYKFEF